MNNAIVIPIQPGNPCMWNGQMAIVRSFHLDQRIVDGERVDAILAQVTVREGHAGGVLRQAWLTDLSPYSYIPK